MLGDTLRGKDVLVTGGAGFIGSHLVDRLIELSARVTVLDNLSFGCKENVNPAADLLEHDVTSYSQVEKDVRNKKLVFHSEEFISKKFKPTLAGLDCVAPFLLVIVSKGARLLP